MLFVEPAVEAVVEPSRSRPRSPSRRPSPRCSRTSPSWRFPPRRAGPEEPAEEPFVAESPATPFMADDAADHGHAEAWFVADVQEPAPKIEPSPSKTDTWSGRAVGS